ncbi:MAG: nucleotide exchange factor GrpE [Lachnospiraceae bacterium]|nr:nucleotide exchange factor GrpE [Lachnospiraceae bacterium]
MAKEKTSAEKANKEAEEKKTEETKTEETKAEETTSDVESKASEEVASEEATSEEKASGETEDAPKKEKKGLFGKKTDSEKDKLKEQVEELNDKLIRQMAEFDNFRKRTEKEKDQMFETGAKSVIEKILPVIDNFERGFQAVEKEDEEDSFTQGMRMVYKQLMDELDKMEVKPIEATGKEFDPNLHNAVMHIDDESLGENIVAEELQKGYTYRGSVVRHSMVKVAN